MATVRDIDGLTVETLASTTEPVEGPGWPEPRGYPVTQCLLCILNEEWEHRLYAERDLDALGRAELRLGRRVRRSWSSDRIELAVAPALLEFSRPIQS